MPPGRTIADHCNFRGALEVLRHRSDRPPQLIAGCSGVPIRPNKLHGVHAPLDRAAASAGTGARNIYALRLLECVESAVVAQVVRFGSQQAAVADLQRYCATV